MTSSVSDFYLHSKWYVFINLYKFAAVYLQVTGLNNFWGKNPYQKQQQQQQNISVLGPISLRRQNSKQLKLWISCHRRQCKIVPRYNENTNYMYFYSKCDVNSTLSMDFVKLIPWELFQWSIHWNSSHTNKITYVIATDWCQASFQNEMTELPNLLFPTKSLAIFTNTRQTLIKITSRDHLDARDVFSFMWESCSEHSIGIMPFLCGSKTID